MSASVAPGGPNAQPAHTSACTSRSPPAPSFRSGSSISATGPGRNRRTSAASASARSMRSCRRAASSRILSSSSADNDASPIRCRTSSSAVRASRSPSASATESFTVRAPWPVTNPASHSGYHSCSVMVRTASALRRPRNPCTSSTSTSEPGHTSRRPYDPSATSATPSSCSSRSKASHRAASIASASAWPNARPRSDASSSSAARASRSRAAITSECASERVGTGLPCANAEHIVDRLDPDLAVADLAGTSGLDDPLDDASCLPVLHERLELHLGNEVDRVLRAAVNLGVAALATESLHLGDRDAMDAELLKCGFHVVELERLDDGYDELHRSLLSPSEIPVIRSDRSRLPLGKRVPTFGMLAEVEPRVLFFFRDTHASRQDLVEYEDNRERHEAGPHDRGDDRRELIAEQGQAAPEEQAVGAELVHCLVREDPEQQRPHDPADEVHTDHVERVVVFELELDLDGGIADGAGDEPDCDRRHAADETG